MYPFASIFTSIWLNDWHFSSDSICLQQLSMCKPCLRLSRLTLIQASWPTLSQHSRKFWYQPLLSRRHSSIGRLTPLAHHYNGFYLKILDDFFTSEECATLIALAEFDDDDHWKQAAVILWFGRSPKLCQTQITETANEYCALKPLITKLLEIYPSDCFPYVQEIKGWDKWEGIVGQPGSVSGTWKLVGYVHSFSPETCEELIQKKKTFSPPQWAPYLLALWKRALHQRPLWWSTRSPRRTATVPLYCSNLFGWCTCGRWCDTDFQGSKRRQRCFCRYWAEDGSSSDLPATAAGIVP